MSTQTAILSPTVTPRSQLAGRIVTALPVLFLLWDAVIKLLRLPPVLDAFQRLELPAELSVAIGLLELGCLTLYVLPRTAFLGAVLLTGFLGGATLTHVRVGDPLFTHVLFASYVGTLVWLGLYLREPRLRALLPLRA